LQKVNLILIIIIGLLTGCSVTKRSARNVFGSGAVPGNAMVVQSVTRNNISNYDFFVRKAEITVRQESYNENFNTNIRFRRPDSLLISLRSKLGIEAARIFITSDTLMVNDRINKKLIVGNTKSLEKKYGIDFNLIFTILGDFVVDKKDLNRPIKCVNGIFSDTFFIEGRKVVYTGDCRKGKIKDAYFEGAITKGNISMKYEKYRSFDGIMLPENIEMKDDLSGLTVEIKIGSAEAGWNGKIKFIGGGGYEVISLK
jgi:outer membrane biogenesis lipoprotein LolB